MITARDITPVIMVGGPRTRLDFFSSQGRPKPFVKLLSAHSPFQQTIFRALPFRKPVIVCHEKFHILVQEQLEEIGAEAQCIILEPEQKGTTAALALASFALKQENTMMAIMPCYPIRHDPYQDILDAALYAEQMIVLLGKRLVRPQSRYGYILSDGKKGERCQPVWAFVERPSKSGALALSKTKGTLWSTGFLVCRPRFFLDVLSKLEPEIFKICERSFYAGKQRHRVVCVDERNYRALASSAIGFSVMEKIKEACVVEMKASTGS